MGEPSATSLTGNKIQAVLAPIAPVYRITRIGGDPFEPAPIEYCGNNRFDDVQGEFRIVYCASERAAAFGETLARYRRSMSLLALMREVEDDEESLEDALEGLLDANDEQRGIVPLDWRFKRQIGATVLDPSLTFAAIAEPESVAHLRAALATQVRSLGLPEFDLGTVTSHDRRITQLCARYIYEHRDEGGQPSFAGISYPSKLNRHWICWAVFADRMLHTPYNLETTIDPNDPDFLEAARLLDLSIEAVRGHGTFIRP